MGGLEEKSLILVFSCVECQKLIHWVLCDVDDVGWCWFSALTGITCYGFIAYPLYRCELFRKEYSVALNNQAMLDAVKRIVPEMDDFNMSVYACVEK